MDETLEAQSLILTLSQKELLALEGLTVGESLRGSALRLETDLFGALRIRKSMKTKLGASFGRRCRSSGDLRRPRRLEAPNKGQMSGAPNAPG
jgi:hypothetical protein